MIVDNEDITMPEESPFYNQLDEKWQSIYWGDDPRANFGFSGCGIFAFCNAVYALTGRLPDALETAEWAIATDAYATDGSGTYRKIFFCKVEAKYGKELGFTVRGQYKGKITDRRLKNALMSGDTAIVHVPCHFLVLTGYDPEKDQYHVIESNVSFMRFIRADSWLSAAKLSRGNTRVDWYAILSRRQTDVQSDDQTEGR